MASKTCSWARTIPHHHGGYRSRGVWDGTALSAKNRGIDLDRISQVRARQDVKTLDKISNTKDEAALIAEHIQGWLPTPSTDPDSQPKIANLRSQLAELRERLGDEPTKVSTPPCTGQQSSSSQSTPIQRALLGSGAPSPPPSFNPVCLLTIHACPTLGSLTTCPRAWQIGHLPSGSRKLQLSDVQRNKVGQCHKPYQGADSRDQYDQLTTFTSLEETQAQSASILSSSSLCNDPGRVHFNTLHHVIHHFSFSRVSYCTDPYDGPVHHPRPPA